MYTTFTIAITITTYVCYHYVLLKTYQHRHVNFWLKEFQAMACDVPQPLDEGKQPIGFVSRHELSREFGEIVDRSLRQVLLELLPQGLLRMETPVSPQSPVPVRPPVKPSRWPQGAAASSSSLGALGCSSSMASACSARRPLFATQSSDLSVADSEGATSFKDAAICRSRLGARPQALRVSAARVGCPPRRRRSPQSWTRSSSGWPALPTRPTSAR